MTDRDSAAIEAELEEATAPRKKGELKNELVEALKREKAALYEEIDDIVAARTESVTLKPYELPREFTRTESTPYSEAVPAGFVPEAALIDQIVTRIGAEAKPGVRQAFVYNSVRQAVNTRRVLLEIATVHADGRVDLPPWPSNRDRETGELLPDKPDPKPSEPVKFESEAEMEARVEAEREQRIAEALAQVANGPRTMSEDERKIVAAGLGGGMPSL